MYSSNKQTPCTLAVVTPAEADRFLKGLANLRDEAKAAAQFEKRFGIFLNRDGGLSHVLGPVELKDDDELWKGAFSPLQPYRWLFAVRDELREIWTINKPTEKEWRIFLFRLDPSMTISAAIGVGPPAPTPFQQAVMYLFKFAARTSRCQNPECPAPYFFATRKTQKFCSDGCSLPTQREFKRKWWHEHGRTLRRQKAKDKKRMKHTR